MKKVNGKDHLGNAFSQNVVMERPLTIYLNKQEVVTSMTVGDHPEWMAVGFLVNQGMLGRNDKITSIDLDWEAEVIVVRTKKETNYEIIPFFSTNRCLFNTNVPKNQICAKVKTNVLFLALTQTKIEILLVATGSRDQKFFLKTKYFLLTRKLFSF